MPILRPVPIIRFRLITGSEFEDRVIEALTRIGLVHVKKSVVYKNALLPRPLRLFIERKYVTGYKELDEILESIKSLSTIFGGSYYEKALVIVNKIRNLMTKIELIKFLRKLRLEVADIRRHKYMFIYTGIMPKSNANKAVQYLKKIHVLCAIREFSNTDMVLVVSIGSRIHEEEALGILRDSGFIEIDLSECPRVEYDELLKILKDDQVRLYNELAMLVDNIAKDIHMEGRVRTTIDLFLNYVGELEDLLKSIRELLYKVNAKPPEILEKALRREVVAQAISIEKLSKIAMDLKNMLGNYRRKYEELYKLIEPPAPPKIKVKEYSMEAVLREL
ncbi:MAG: hypothetical protein J7K21_04855, partial [Desulfurococcales archaeon]|nr:hypothetical protein [Desulfurococcales archaeon]